VIKRGEERLEEDGEEESRKGDAATIKRDEEEIRERPINLAQKGQRREMSFV